MLINAANLNALFLGFKSSFQRGLGMAPPQWDRVATRIPSSTAEEKYDWLGEVPNMREWIGDRHVHALMVHDYAIRNKRWEQTIAVGVDRINDDQYGVLTPRFEAMGRATAAHPNQLVFGLLKDGFTQLAYDGQPFFDADHPVLDEQGVPQSVSNTGGGSGTPWFLIASMTPLKPIIYQVRQEPNFVRLDNETDENVFMRDEFLYGVKSRSNVGFGFWQFAYGSKETLNVANYVTARTAILEMKSDYGRPLGLVPDLLVIPPSLEGAARTVVKADLINGGDTNVWRDTADILVVPWLA